MNETVKKSAQFETKTFVLQFFGEKKKGFKIQTL